MPEALLTSCIRGGSEDGEPGWIITFHYRADLVDAIKVIPYTRREWRPDEHKWWVSETYEAVLLGLFTNFKAFRDQPRMF